MALVLKRSIRRTLLLAAFASSAACAQDSPSVKKFQIHVTEPAYIGLPFWVQADPGVPQEVRYPYHEDPSDFGPNRLEVRRGDQIHAPVPFKPWFGGEGIVDGSIAPPGSPTNRLPLHLQFALDAPGIYSIRWTSVQHTLAGGQVNEVIVAQSDWLTFELKQSSPEQRNAWLQQQLARRPTDVGAMVGDFLPSLLARAPDPRVLAVVMEELYSSQEIVRSCALASLRLFREDDIRAQTLDLLHRRGPNDPMAYLTSWRAPWFQDRKDEIVRTTLPYLDSTENSQVAATLKLLGFLVHLGNFQWPAGSTVPSECDRSVLDAAPRLTLRSSEVSQALANYLGGIKSAAAREPLWRLAEGERPESEQALIALTWIADPRDLAPLAELLIKSGTSDKYGRDRASLAYSLVRAYGDRAVPYLEKAVIESPYAFVRTQCAEQLVLKGRPLGFRLFLDAVETNQFYKSELISWLKGQFPREISQAADEAAVAAFLRAHLAR